MSIFSITMFLLATILAMGTASPQQRAGQRRADQSPQSPRDLDDKQGDYEKNSRRAAPKNTFPVFDNPQMTQADKTTLGDQEYVIGVECDGEAKAYPIAVMGRHELGNDVCGNSHITISW